MFKVLLVDDEQIICKGLRQTVPWEDFGAEVIGEAYDGEEALEIIERMEVNLVISDVKMPVMDGLKLADQIANRYPYIRMIIISGYDEFNYAKRALKYRVRDYLLKPVDIDELLKLVKTIKNEDEQEKQQEWEYSISQSLTSLAMKHVLKKRDSTNRLLMKGYRLIGSEIKEYAREIHPLSDEEKNYIKQQWVQQLEKELVKKGIYCTSVFISKNRLITCSKLNLDDNQTLSVLNEAILVVNKKIGYELNICFSAYSESASELPNLFKITNNGMQAHPFTEENVYKSNEVAILSEKAAPEFFEHQFKKIDEVSEDFIPFSNSLFQYFRENHWPMEEIVGYLKAMEEKHFKEFMDILHFNLLHQVEVDIYNSYNQMERLFLEDLQEYFTYRKTLAHSSQQTLAKQATIYMNEHFSSDIKATEVADAINVSANYFSQLIKQETGQHFNDYLHAIRINNAKILLKETPYHIFEIAEMVGYKDYKYFVHIFKKLTNITPTQYRNMKISNASVEVTDK